jgi:hypothetical protein
MVGKGKRKIEAIGYMRTSSATNVGRDKDSEARQRAAIESYRQVESSAGQKDRRRKLSMRARHAGYESFAKKP